METIIDLHMHSIYSADGEFSPQELVRRCQEAGVTVMSIADHNCAKAAQEARPAAEAAGIRYIPGIEIDCSFQGVDLHLLGYDVDPEDPVLAAIEENVRRQSQSSSIRRLELVRELGFDLAPEELDAVTAGGYWQHDWPGEAIAEVLLAREDYRDHPLLAPYRPGGARSDNPYVNFYWDYCSQGKPCFAPMEFPTLAQAIEDVHRAGGVAVLAHPGNNLAGRFSLLEEMLPLGLDGVEAFSSYHTPEVNRYFWEKAQEHGLLATCGSDFHGKNKPRIFLGGCGCIPQEREEVAQQLLRRGLLPA